MISAASVSLSCPSRLAKLLGRIIVRETGVCRIIEAVTWTWTVPDEIVIKFNTCRMLISISGIVVRHDDEASRTNTYVDETLLSAGRQVDDPILI